MNTEFAYKLRPLPVLILLLVFCLFAAAFFFTGRVPAAAITGAIWLLLEAAVVIYYRSKRLILDDWGVKMRVFGKWVVNGAPWTNMAEASLCNGKLAEPPRSGIMSISPAVAGAEWMANKIKVSLVKIHIANSDPLFIDLRALRDGSTVLDLVKQKVKFVQPRR